jgi:recombination protein RecR
MKKYPTHLIKLIDVLKRLPGVGNKSAERFAFDLIDWPQSHLKEMAAVLDSLRDHLDHCQECGCLVGKEGCPFCNLDKRDPKLLCIVAYPKDVFALEDTHEYRGVYHVLGNLLSPLEGKGPEQLRLSQLRQRIADLQVKEVVIALDSTLEGDATALYLKKELENSQLSISRLAFGLPMGSSLDYVDGGTLARAFAGRARF